MSTLNPEQSELLEQIREKANALAGLIVEADTAGIPPAILLPELVTILREAGFEIPNWIAGLGARALR